MSEQGQAPDILAMRALTSGLASRVAAGAALVPADSTDRPDLVLVDPKHGVVAVEIADSSDPLDREPYRRLNRKVKEMVRATPCTRGGSDPQSCPVERESRAPPRRTRLGRLRDQGHWSWRSTRRNVARCAGRGRRSCRGADSKGSRCREERVEDRFRRRRHWRCLVARAFVFEARPRKGAEDEGKAQRAALRFQLDAQQAGIAMRPIQDVLVLTGPPGSGKTLVLAARARWLSEQHPNWHIQLLCFNHALVLYLQSLVAGRANVHVSTYHSWAKETGGADRRAWRARSDRSGASAGGAGAFPRSTRHS